MTWFIDRLEGGSVGESNAQNNPRPNITRSALHLAIILMKQAPLGNCSILPDSDSQYIASNARMIIELPHLRYYSGVCLERFKDITKEFN